MKKRNRSLALLLAFAVCFAVLFSTFYIAAKVDHDCIIEDCPICYQISICENTLKYLGYFAAAMATAFALVFAAAILSRQPNTHPKKPTLVTLKVKLSN